jgi:hypothetical protein
MRRLFANWLRPKSSGLAPGAQMLPEEGSRLFQGDANGLGLVVKIVVRPAFQRDKLAVLRDGGAALYFHAIAKGAKKALPDRHHDGLRQQWLSKGERVPDERLLSV